MITRMPPGLAKRRLASAFSLAVAAAAYLVLASCSPGADYPSLFPAVHDRSSVRSDTPLDPNQVQQATEDLISARDRLSAEAQSGQGKTSTKPASTKPASTKPALAKPAAAKPASAQSASATMVKKQPSPAPAANPTARQAIGADDTQRTGAETK
jgi:cell division septation protein DedD